MVNNIKLLSIGHYLPRTEMSSGDIEKIHKMPRGILEKKTGVKFRHYANGETAVEMGVMAVKNAINKINYNMDDIDCIIGACGVAQQPIPCMAALISRELGRDNGKIACFDINSTCLSFVTAIEIASIYIESGHYKNILVVSSDIASIGLDYDDYKSSGLFGDGAAAAIVTKAKEGETSKLLASKMETFSKGSEFARIRGGGNLIHPCNYSEETKKDFLFNMDGIKIYKEASKYIKGFVDGLVDEANISINDISLVIPHQASLSGLRLVQKKLGIPSERFMILVENLGNMIAASIPTLLSIAIESGKIKRGDKVMLIGTSAGLSLGGLIFEY